MVCFKTPPTPTPVFDPLWTCGMDLQGAFECTDCEWRLLPIALDLHSCTHARASFQSHARIRTLSFPAALVGDRQAMQLDCVVSEANRRVPI